MNRKVMVSDLRIFYFYTFLMNDFFFSDDELLKESPSSNFYSHKNGIPNHKHTYKERVFQKPTTTTTTARSNNSKIFKFCNILY